MAFPTRLCGLPSTAVFLSLALLAASGTDTDTTPAQQTTTMSVQVNVVNVLATVRDKHGKIINDLNQQDFTLTEDGRPQTIHYFTKETDLPLTLGLLVDTSISQREVLDQERKASHSFLDSVVREDKDKAFVLHFDRYVELLQDLTSSHEKLESALNDLETPKFTPASAGNSPDADPDSGRGPGRHRGGGTLLYDAIYLASDKSGELMSKQQGRKAVIILSDGVDRGSKESLDTAISTSQRANTIIYSIVFKGEEGFGNHRGFGGPRIGMGGGGMGVPGMGGPMGGGGVGRRGGGGYPREERADGKKILEQISLETGGRMFEVSKKQPLEQIYSQIEEELRNQYNIGYTPDRGGAAAEGYHKIQLTTGRKDAIVQTREGYYADR